MPSKLPTAIKQTRGTDRPDRRNQNEPVLDVGSPRMPPGLTKLEKEHWNELVIELRLMGVLTQADRISLKQLVRTEVQVDRLWKMIITDEAETVSITSTQKEAILKPHPLYDKLLAHQNILIKLYQAFGLDPVARTAVHTVTPAPKSKAAPAASSHGNESSSAPQTGTARFFQH